jgi:hypothetical protein
VSGSGSNSSSPDFYAALTSTLREIKDKVNRLIFIKIIIIIFLTYLQPIGFIYMSSITPSQSQGTEQPAIKHEHHLSDQSKRMSYASMTALAVGAILLVGVAGGLMAAHGLPLFGNMGSALSSHSWAVLAGVEGLVGISIAGELYLKHQKDKLPGTAEKLFQAFDDSIIALNPPRSFIPHEAAIEKRFEALKNSPHKKGFMTLTPGSAEEIVKNGECGTYVVPEGLFLICTKDEKGYAVHHYENLASFETAKTQFGSENYFHNVTFFKQSPLGAKK